MLQQYKVDKTRISTPSDAIQVVSHHTGMELRTIQGWRFVQNMHCGARKYCVVKNPRTGFKVAYLEPMQFGNN